MSEYIRGWEIMYCLHKEDVKTKLDLILLVLHFSLIKHGFLALEFTTDKETYDPKTHGPGKEKLPPCWNKFGSNVVLNYIYQNKHYRLHCGSSTGLIVFNLIEQGEEPQVSSMLLNVETEIKISDGQPLGEVQNLEGILRKIEQELIQPLSNKNSKEIHTQTDTEKTKKKADQPGVARSPGMANIPTPIAMQPPPLNVGTNDLHTPLGWPMPGGVPRPNIPGGIPAGGGGMIYDPFRQPTVRPPGMAGYVPGARFDPIGVPPPNPLGPYAPRQPGPHYQPGSGAPDPDHLPPPGYDDMFM